MATLSSKKTEDESKSLTLFAKEQNGVEIPLGGFYGSTDTNHEEYKLLVGKPTFVPRQVEHEVAELIYLLFTAPHHYSHTHPRTNPPLPPEHRGKRHRNYYIYLLNQFRHWWKTSRLLVKCSGGFVYCHDASNWSSMAAWDVTKKKQFKHAFKNYKHIGQGGDMRLFSKMVKPFTRSIRIILAVARAWEAKVDNRVYEYGLAEAFAFMGNRCSRYWSRQLSDLIMKQLSLPLSGMLVAPLLTQQSRPVIIAMGFVRTILPFAASFQGSRVGRQLTFNTYKFANYRWHSLQGVKTFHEDAGNYQDTDLDPDLLELARDVAEHIGHGKNPLETRNQLKSIGFEIFGSGCGGYSVYRTSRDGKVILLHVTPYGPGIDDEMPRYILIERRRYFYTNRLGNDVQATILDAATPREAKLQGFTYSGAFFRCQEWAALKERYDRELADYSEACKIMGTRRIPVDKRYPLHNPSPPEDLDSLKTFIRSGRVTFRQRRDNQRWAQIKREVNKLAARIKHYQKSGKAPKRIILYLEGLDCSGKSSTGMLICRALEQCGYDVTIAQHNRPPTEMQHQKNWMDRIRFQYPDDMYQDKCPQYASVVWDRGPAGDFVYGDLSEITTKEKLERYEEFRQYDSTCRKDGVLFLKCLFVTDRDSIAETLGKRLAHKKIVRDLKAWLDSNSTPHTREGLDLITMHIDPSDFVAFNKYERNLAKFTEFARNTDNINAVDDEYQKTFAEYKNPWFIINTASRHPARLSLLRAFGGRVARFANSEEDDSKSVFDWLSSKFKKSSTEEYDALVPSKYVGGGGEGISVRAIFQSFLLLLLLYSYAYQTWNFNIDYMT